LRRQMPATGGFLHRALRSELLFFSAALRMLPDLEKS
jgi:hypothetical protein